MDDHFVTVLAVITLLVYWGFPAFLALYMLILEPVIRRLRDGKTFR